MLRLCNCFEIKSFNLATRNLRYSVRALTSKRSGNGKSTYVKNFHDRVSHKLAGKFLFKIIRIKDATLNMNNEIQKLMSNQSAELPTIYHIDIAYEVFKNVDQFLFDLIVCRHLRHGMGGVWRRNDSDLYLIELSPPYRSRTQKNLQLKEHEHVECLHSMLKYLPSVEFRTPREYLYDLKNSDDFEPTPIIAQDNWFETIYKEDRYQRSSYYLGTINEIKQRRESNRGVKLNSQNFEADLLMNSFVSSVNECNQINCLETILTCSKLTDPNWHELNNFVNFLNQQLEMCEAAVFLKEIRNLKSLTIQMLVIMANDFGLPSLSSPAERPSRFQIHLPELSRRWEQLLHPYIILNADGESITFLGTYIDRSSRNFVNPNTRQPLLSIDPAIPPISSELYIQLLTQRVKIFDNFNGFIREQKIQTLCRVMGLEQFEKLAQDTGAYELTLDNCLKMMAIYLRFKANNPVIIMGETGCGKTSLITFFSRLNLRGTIQTRNLIHVKIHGGTSAREIENCLREAEALAKTNMDIYKSMRLNPNANYITAILFFDEANTTESIGLIKEIMCDSTCNGRPVELENGLKIIAAINPYKKHSIEMISKLEQAGLGFYVSADETKERFGHIPMRQLVYRVQPLPTSLLPIVWDFGQLEANVENTYINQMLNRAVINKRLPPCNEAELAFLCHLINQSQNFMRAKNDECSFVSIRDVERVLKLTEWFLKKKELIFGRMTARVLDSFDSAYQSSLTDLKRAFILGNHFASKLGLRV